MNDRQLPAIHNAFAYWTTSGAVQVALHGEDYKDDRVATLTPAQALKLAEQLTRAAREALVA
jgi:hypothetical protein